LDRLRGKHARVESLVPAAGQGWDLICSRAFATLGDFVRGSRAALAESGMWMAMKGQHPVGEIEALPGDVEVFHVEPLQVPLLDAQRCIVWMRPIRR
jgi:16S rRNA (guanine527-N7)-methyltransferase